VSVVDVRQISDRLEIEEVLIRYTRAIDTGEWDALDTVFTPDAAIDYTQTGGIADSYPKVKAWLAENLPMFPRRMHMLGQVEIRMEPGADEAPDEAGVAAYFSNPMIFAQQDGSELLWEFGGIYHHRMVRTPDGWRSRELVEELLWKRGL
jgi:SnoaL-like domain